MKKGVRIAYIVCSFVTGAMYGYSLYKAIAQRSAIGIIIYSIFFILCLITDFLAEKSLKNDEKKIALGVISILFVGPIAGVLYLVWQPVRYAKSKLNNPATPVEGKEAAGEYYVGDTISVELASGGAPVECRVVYYYHSIGKYLVSTPTSGNELITPDQIVK